MQQANPKNNVSAIAVNLDAKPITLDEPIVRGDEEITAITVHKPTSGALRGVSLIAVANLDVSSLQTLLPRICDPILTKKEVANLGPADLMSLGAAVATFFIPKSKREELEIE